ncbi:hypothetical protein [Bacillus gaemokensis]|uniref:hypothetical protein n=1 Tax=Bacillus gaemokensis TaxID=574375 RepID=UPI0006914908|nr:hypothetical protein [Bacillus gaemokensis]KYG38129.1 hypothetical protein AZF08_20485 [Bacillus gaemokensis]
MTNLQKDNKKEGLQKEKGFNTLIGKVKVNDKTFSGIQVSEKTGYNYVRINFGVETEEGNTVYCEMMGGYFPSKPVIIASSKDDNSRLEINWADRLNEMIVDSVSDFRLHKIGLDRNEKGELNIKKFLSPVDVHEYLKENLKDGMEISVRGKFGFSEYNQETQRKFQIQNIFLPFQKKDEESGELLPVEYKAEFVQTILLDEESFKRVTKQDREAGEVVVSAYVVDYVNKKDNKEIKKNLPFSQPIVVPINKENPEMTEKILDALFKVKKGKVRRLTIEGKIVEGFEKQEVSEADIEISPEIQELIAMGLYSEEEAKKKMTVRGNKVSKLVFTRPHIMKDKDDATKIMMDKSDDIYTPEDLVIPEPEEMESESYESTGETAGGDAPSDASWMTALGITGEQA